MPLAVVMNPPYNGNLHLKILQEVLKHSDDVINLSPVRWLTDQTASRKKNSDWYKFKSVRDKIADLDIITAQDANDIFNAQFSTNLGVYTFDKDGGYEVEKNALLEKIFDFNCERLGYKMDFTKEYKFILPATHGHAGMEDWAEVTSKVYETALTVQANGSTSVYVKLSFDTEKERRNFYDSLFTKFYKYLIGNMRTGTSNCIFAHFLPFMEDYTEPWTDQRLYEYFNLTEDEIKTIENWRCL